MSIVWVLIPARLLGCECDVMCVVLIRVIIYYFDGFFGYVLINNSFHSTNHEYESSYTILLCRIIVVCFSLYDVLWENTTENTFRQSKHEN